MSEAIHCKIKPETDAGTLSKNYNVEKVGYIPATFKITRAASPDSPEIHTINCPKDFYFQMGDKIKALTASVTVLIKPQAPVGVFVLKPIVPHNSHFRIRTELEINAKTTIQVQRGKVRVAEDIGSTNVHTGTVTR